ncbi:helix-turn-helix domain-containing protein [Advenella sp. EE-W14]|uniref:transcriptional regulator n=1 Tax=Advenella sp. EE-W14 TaxID=2722705 RepID=UPI00145FC89F|nr:helix-turn-helix domain-containing protein [Advenella sp. EE-W14]
MQLLDFVNAERGIRAKLAKDISVPQILISQWALKRRQVPAERCPDIEQATNGQVTCEELRPDVNWSVLRNKKGSTNA